MNVVEIDKVVAVNFIQKYHYSKIMPRITKYYLGFYEEEQLKGVITLGWGTQPLQTIKKIFYQDDLFTTDYIEIGKMCFLPECNGSNFGSKAISALINWIKQNTSVLFLYTLADGIMGKCGYVYQASNFIYIGKFKTSVYRDKQTGEKIHPRSAKNLLKENALYINKDKVFWLTDDFCQHKKIDKISGYMFRYIFPLNKRARRIFKKYTEYQNLKNPKDSDLRYYRRIVSGKFEEINQPCFNMDVFKYNFQKYEEPDIDLGSHKVDLWGSNHGS